MNLFPLFFIIFVIKSIKSQSQTTATLKRIPITISQVPIPTSFPITSTTKLVPSVIDEVEIVDVTETSTHETVLEKTINQPTGTTPISITSSSDSMDPTDYSTVWPTRWRPRGRRFGAQNEAQYSFKSNKWTLFFLIFTFICGLLL